MSPRKPNMLEAFQASDAEPPPPPPARAPRAPKLPRARRSARPDGASLPEWAERAPVFLAATLVGIGLLAGAYWLGRLSASGEASSSEVYAAGPEGERWSFPDPVADARTSAPPAAEPAAPREASTDELDAEGRTADDRSFYDKANRFTVRAIYYGKTNSGWKRALAAYRYLRAQGLPAIAPVDQGDILVLCVGAEPRREGRLAELCERVRALPGPPPRSEAGAFAGAYFVNIDDLVERP